MNYRITHRTVYEYPAPVTVSHHAARLEPLHDYSQQRADFSLAITPEPTLRNTRADYFGNQVCFFTIQEIHTRLEIQATSTVRVGGCPPPAPLLSAEWGDVAKMFAGEVPVELLDPYQFVFDSPQIRCTPELAEFARPSFTAGRPLLAAVFDLNRRIHREFKFDPKATTVLTAPEEVIVKRRGVCQDFAQVAIACLRSLGLPARYVSGYLRTRPPQGKERLVGADASHAWFEVFCPGYGWVDFDPTNDVMPDEEHVRIACGRDFSDVSPVSGMVVGGGQHVVKVSVDVEPV